MRNRLRRLISMLTPWWNEAEAERRAQSTQVVLQQSADARKRADQAVRHAFETFTDATRK